MTGSVFQNFYTKYPNLGSLYFSDTLTIQFRLQSSTINCTTTAFTAATAISELTVGTYSSSTNAGAIYFGTSQSGITSTGNTFSNCHNLGDGGIYYIEGSAKPGFTVLTESSNTYTNIYALYGSIMKCSNCNFTITSSTMDGSRAYSGGAFFVENQAAGTVMSTSLKNVMAVTQGGVMTIIQSGISSLQATTITFKNCPNLIGNKASEGGVFYINQPKIQVLLDTVKISNANAATLGGVFSIKSALNLTFYDVEVTDVTSPNSAVLYSTSSVFTLSIQKTVLICNSLYSTSLVAKEF